MVAGGPGLLASSGEAGRAVRDVLGADRARTCLVAATGSPADEQLLWDASLSYLPRGTMRLGPEAGTDLTVAAIAEAAALVTDDRAAALVARAYGVPVVVAAQTPGAEPLAAAVRRALAEPGAGDDAGADLARLDAALDRLVEDARRGTVVRAARAAPEAAAERNGAADASTRLELTRRATEARTRRLMGELARERERAAALERELGEQTTMLDHVQAAYESLRAHVQVAQLRAEQAEATLAAAQFASAQQLASAQANSQHTIGALEAQLKHYVATVEVMEGQISLLTAERDAALGDAAQQAAHVAAVSARAEALAAELASVRETLDTIVNSRSWRALAPARSAGEVIRRLSE